MKNPRSGLVVPLRKYLLISLCPLSILPALPPSLFSCYETLQLKPRLPQFITGGTKAKALDKAGQTNSNQLPLNTHITPLSVADTQMVNSRRLAFLISNVKNGGGDRLMK